MKLTARDWLLSLVVLAVPIASYFLVFRPQNIEIERAKREVEHKQSLLAKLREETARNDDLVRANGEIRRKVEEIEARLPSNKEVDSIIRQVSELAVQSGLGSPAMKNGKPRQEALYMEQPLEISMTGNFQGFYDFLSRLERLPRITRIPIMKIKRDDADGDGNMRAEFTLSIYYQDVAPLAQGAPQ